MDPFGLTTPAAFPLGNMFGTVPENNVTFCVDTSGSMYNGLDCVKEQLMEVLMRHAYERRAESSFNIIEFNSNVTQWADKMVKCTPETVKVAAEWVSTLEAKTGTNTQNALLAALSDPICEAVYLVTDGLPDQHSEDVLDHIGYAGQGRPVHCIYLVKGTSDHAALKFLRTLAEETYGFFNVVTLTTHGCLEKVTPLIRMDSINSHVMKTSNGNIYPKQKTCSVSTTLQSDPEEALIQMQTLFPWGQAHPYLSNWWRRPDLDYHGLGFGWQNSYAWPFHHPLTDWSRYRLARSWLKAQHEMLDEFDNPEQSPAAGSLILNKPVLARRLHDGYFYNATVQTQILENKFVVAFGPCKHGKYTNTTYEETWVHDIISYNDAKRHAIVTGDKVLAPWEPDGERFCPGTVIDGQETREAKGPATDHQITVTFANGHTETVPLDEAVWIPPAFSERLTLELQMPCEARKSLECQPNYPEDSLPGYPASGSVRRPKEFWRPHHVGFLHHSPAVMAGLYQYPDYIPVYPVIHKGSQYGTSCVVTSESMNTLIPGTEMTKQDLRDKVMSQLSEHRNKLREEYNKQADSRSSSINSHTHRSKLNESYPLYENNSSYVTYPDRLLDKRETLSENSFRKSVSWKDGRSSPRNGLDNTDDDSDEQDADSGVSVSPELLDRWEVSSRPSSHSYYRDDQCNRSPDVYSDRMPSRGYWSYPQHRSARSSSHRKTGTAQKGPQQFCETAIQAPLEARDQKLATADVEWPCSHFKYVDTFAKHDRPYTVKDLMNMPRPPANEPHSSTNKDNLLSQQAGHELKEMRNVEFKRKKTFEREANRQQQQDEREIQIQRSMAKHRREVQNRLNKSQQTEFENKADMTRTLETKRHASTQLREQWADKQVQPFDREERRIAALRDKREKREAEQSETMREKAELAQSREEVKRVRSQERWNEVNQQLDDQEAAMTKQMRHCRLTSDLTAQRFHNKEAQAQELKDRRIGVTGQQLAIYRSQVLP